MELMLQHMNFGGAFCPLLPLIEHDQCSCLENPRDGGVWWAAIYGAAQSQTRLKRLSSSSSSSSSRIQGLLAGIDAQGKA